MATKTRIEKGVYSIERMISRYKEKAPLRIMDDVVIINEKRSGLWGNIFYVVFLIIGPIIIVLMSLKNQEKWNLAIISVAPLIFGWNLYRMVKGNNVLFINLHTKQITTENINPVFGRLFRKRIIPFENLKSVEILEHVVSGRYSNTIWHQIVVTTKDRSSAVLTDFDYRFPQSFIATKVLFLIQQIIDTYKEKK
ncbi:hypothetical protein [Flavihumibacter sp. ZG627]|uniref:hypothetical protein n=1 Tax=Flavihumibacter sp. ZG627 TaxID=1463156 RepID=UPI00057CE58F|nr:hypothetical protein [Flavihumibacter sp. ZG627]KIC91329.1 hypothetical protein HY58_03500 [Flavihumibacter sp. ZG627]